VAKHRFPDLKIKASGDNGLIEGYGAVFGNVDLMGDICLPGCFTASLEAHKEAETMPAMLMSHDQAAPVGKWLEMYEDDVGLFVKGRLTMALQAAKDVFSLALDSALSLSIGFSTDRGHFDADKKANVLEAVSLGEISFVAPAANSQAKITSVKTLSTVRDYERALHSDYGLSARAAKKLIHGGWKSFSPGHENEQKQLADLIRASGNKFGV
jgi:HK97 family phage prohead protease